MEKIKLFIAIPTTGTIADTQVARLRDLQATYGDKIEFIYPEKMVRRIFHDFARNAMVEDFLDSKADILWFLDSDVTPPDDILDLVTVHGDKWKVAGAPYPVCMVPGGKETLQIVFTAYEYNAQVKGLCPKLRIPAQGLDFVDGLATGCLFIKREVFTEILPERPFFQFTFNPDTRMMSEGEDFYFMRRCHEKGLKFFTDYHMACRHTKNVDLLELNNYAVEFAQTAIENYKKAFIEDLQAKAAAKRQAQAKPSLIMPATNWRR